MHLDSVYPPLIIGGIFPGSDEFSRHGLPEQAFGRNDKSGTGLRLFWGFWSLLMTHSELILIAHSIANLQKGTNIEY